MPEPVLRAENLIKRYRRGTQIVRALDDVSLTVGKAQTVALMGPSGSGKSTLLMILGALDRPDNGTLYIRGKNAADLSYEDLVEIHRSTIGFIFQDDHLLPALSLRDNVALPLALAGIKGPELEQRAGQLLDALGLGNKLDALAGELSGGQRQRANIARALANDPDVVLADEPTGSLDTQTARQVMDLLLDQAQARKTAVVMVTHDAGTAQLMGRILNLKDGKLAGQAGKA